MMSAMMNVHAPGALIHSTFLLVVTGWPRLCSGEPPFWGTSVLVTTMPGTKRSASQKHSHVRLAAKEGIECFTSADRQRQSTTVRVDVPRECMQMPL